MNKKYIFGIVFALFLMAFGTLGAHAAAALPSLNISLGSTSNPEEFTKGVQILIMMTILTLAPSILIMTTGFIRIVVVLSLTKQALGASGLPPSQVIVSLALILTFFVMSPTFNKINTEAYQPYVKKQITQEVAMKKAMNPLRDFMFRQTDQQELALFVRMAKIKPPKNYDDIPTYVLLPSFTISELKTSFKIGFMVFIPFLVIDIVVASILVSMGMLFLPPSMVATPFKIILFVLIDGWHLISKSLVESFR